MRRRGRVETWAWVLFGAAVLVALGLTATRALSPEGRVLLSDGPAPWIAVDEPFSAYLRQWGKTEAPRSTFGRTFELSAVPEEAALTIAAFGAFAVDLNGKPVPFGRLPAASFQVARQRDVAGWLRPGENRIDVTIANRRGPALLSLRLASGERTLVASSGDFEATLAGRSFGARGADDMRLHPGAHRLPAPVGALAVRLGWVVALFAASAALATAWLRRGAPMPPRAEIWAFCAVGVLWSLFFLRFLKVPAAAGFDARGHLEYADAIRSGVWPTAMDGWSTYHPPLYHAVLALVAAVGDALGAHAASVLRHGPGLIAALVLVWLGSRLARALYPAQGASPIVAACFMAVLPVNVYLAGSVGNDGLLAALAAGALVSATAWMARERVDPRAALGVGVWLGLALLTKFTALVVAAVVGVFGLVKVFAAPKETGATRARACAGLLGAPVVLAGWFYARNVWLFGDPLVANWDLPGNDRVWWTAPGFHTIGYYTEFGRALDLPYFAAYGSFWDALYSTFWGDGSLSGAVGANHGLPWDLSWMAIGYWVGAPLSLVLLVGLGACVRDLWREPRAHLRAARALPLVYLAAIGFAILYSTVSLPYAGQARAPYVLSAAPVLAVAFARAIEVLDAWTARRRLTRILGLGALGMAGGVFALGILGPGP